MNVDGALLNENATPPRTDAITRLKNPRPEIATIQEQTRLMIEKLKNIEALVSVTMLRIATLPKVNAPQNVQIRTVGAMLYVELCPKVGDGCHQAAI